MARRAEIDKLAVAHAKELKVGDALVCKRTPPGATSTLTSLPAGLKGECTVQINMDGRVFDHHFLSLGSGRGGGCVLRPTIEFSPPARKQRKDAVSESTRKRIHEHCEHDCPTSPCAKDRVRKRLDTTQRKDTRGVYAIARRKEAQELGQKMVPELQVGHSHLSLVSNLVVSN